jgi:hypothetical protein
MKLYAGARTYTLDEVRDTGFRQGRDLLGPFPPQEWHECRPSQVFIDAYWRGYEAGVKHRWGAVYLVHCCTMIAANVCKYPVLNVRDRSRTEDRRKVAATIHRIRQLGGMTYDQNRRSFAHIHEDRNESAANIRIGATDDT